MKKARKTFNKDEIPPTSSYWYDTKLEPGAPTYQEVAQEQQFRKNPPTFKVGDKMPISAFDQTSDDEPQGLAYIPPPDWMNKYAPTPSPTQQPTRQPTRRPTLMRTIEKGQ